MSHWGRSVGLLPNPGRLGVVGVVALLALVLATCGKGHPLRAKRLIHPAVRAIERELESPREREVVIPPGLAVTTVYLDAGHGAKDNAGNSSSFCQDEQDFTRLLALDVRDFLEQTGKFRVILSRTASEIVPYAERVAEAERARAAVFISLHSDVRGKGTPWAPQSGKSCLENVDLPGYVVLWSDEGPQPLVAQRHSLARDVSARMAEAGFLRYTGSYQGLYENDPDDLAVLVDRHEAQKRIFVLRRITLPSIIIETHHALDPREAMLWEQEETRRAFSAAIAQALIDFATAG
jgi:N-acetylmuramoyl-L-alanine amidase